jgi:hypothetical protein
LESAQRLVNAQKLMTLRIASSPVSANLLRRLATFYPQVFPMWLAGSSLGQQTVKKRHNFA